MSYLPSFILIPLLLFVGMYASDPAKGSGKNATFSDESGLLSLELPEAWYRTAYSHTDCYLMEGLHFPESKCQSLYLSTKEQFAAIIDFETGVSVKIREDVSSLAIEENDIFTTYVEGEGDDEMINAEAKHFRSVKDILSEFQELKTASETAEFFHDLKVMEYLSTEGEELSREKMKVGAFRGYKSEIVYFRKGELIPPGKHRLYLLSLVDENTAVEIEMRTSETEWENRMATYKHALKSLRFSN